MSNTSHCKICGRVHANEDMSPTTVVCPDCLANIEGLTSDIAIVADGDFIDPPYVKEVEIEFSVDGVEFSAFGQAENMGGGDWKFVSGTLDTGTVELK